MSEMSPFRELISYSEALQKILETIPPTSHTETIPISQGVNRILAQDIVADTAVPPFDRAAMDGYAVQAKDTFGASQRNPKTLKLTEVLHAGPSQDKVLSEGECIQVATGAPLPQGADAVVMVEFTQRDEDDIQIFKPVYPGANIAPKGEDIQIGQVVLKAGKQLSPAKMGALAALGKKRVKVYLKPRIAVVPTGTEIQELGKPLARGQIYDVNSYTLSAVAYQNGGIPTRLKAVPDDIDKLRETIQKLLDHDMIVFSGGSSVGERDLLTKLISQLGTILFHGIQIKPGKPTLFATVEGTPVFGMPGYPTSCLLNAYLFLVPALRQMARLPPKMVKTTQKELAKRVVSSTGRTQFLPVKIEEERVYPVFKQSGDITSLTQADGYIILPINTDVVEKDEEVTVHLFT
ncbi:MAG: gephyrin-like molybdotransferase Glp [Thermoproteota archaeon]